MRQSVPAGAKKRVVILGGGFGGALAAQELVRRANPRDLDVTLIDRNNYMLFYPLLVEAGVGQVEPRHVVVPLRKFLPRGDFRMAEVLQVDLQRRQVGIQVVGAETPEWLHYDELVIALGSVTRVPTNVPGLVEHGFELKSLADAVELRDRGIRLLELANTLPSAQARRDLLRVVVVGANFTGIEMAGEYHAFLTELSHDYANVDESDIEVVVCEYGPRILPAVSEELAKWSHETLAKRGLDIRTTTTVAEINERDCLLTTGERVPTRTVVWAAGIAPNPIVGQIPGVPTNPKGYIECETTLQVKGFNNVWAIGDLATVFDEQGRPYAATAQSASRQGPHVAGNILRSLQGQPLQPFRFKVLGSFAAIGRRQAAGELGRIRVSGFLGWLLYRGTYLSKMPTFAMKVRLLMDWTAEFFLHAPPVQLGFRQHFNRRLMVAPEDNRPSERTSVR